MPSRPDIARAAANALQEAKHVPPALIGFDGFIDSITHMVDRRIDMSPAGYERLRTISAFAQRCAAAAGKSTNIERVLIEDRFGGNGPLMASAVAALGMPTTYIGAIGAAPDDPARAREVHPVFREFAARCVRTAVTGPPSTTVCLEFDDGKLMFNETSAQQAVTWERIVAAVGLEELVRVVDAARLIGIVNWSLLGGVPGIWEGLARDVLPRCAKARRTVSIDLSDPAKRSDEDVRAMLGRLRDLDRHAAVTLGLNLAEAERIARVLGLDTFDRLKSSPRAERVREACLAIREKADLDCVTVHPREGAAAADRSGAAAWFDGPFTPSPRLSTGAGDHYNGGFAFARTRGLPIDQCLAVGCATSGAYVRDAASPSLGRVCELLTALPGSEP